LIPAALPSGGAGPLRREAVGRRHAAVEDGDAFAGAAGAAATSGVPVDPGTTLSFRPPRLGYLDSHIVTGVGTDRFIAIRRRQPTTEHRMLVYVPNWTEELWMALRAQP
jgi:hypothetical protein